MMKTVMSLSKIFIVFFWLNFLTIQMAYGQSNSNIRGLFGPPGNCLGLSFIRYDRLDWNFSKNSIDTLQGDVYEREVNVNYKQITAISSDSFPNMNRVRVKSGGKLYMQSTCKDNRLQFKAARKKNNLVVIIYKIELNDYSCFLHCRFFCDSSIQYINIKSKNLKGIRHYIQAKIGKNNILRVNESGKQTVELPNDAWVAFYNRVNSMIGDGATNLTETCAFMNKVLPH